MAKLTVGWERAEDAAYLPTDSSIVTVPSKLTVDWKPMLNTSVLDWDPADLSITPGAGAEVAPAPPAEETTPTAAAAPAVTVTAPGAPAAPGAPLPPDIRVTVRRTAGLLRKDGLAFEVLAPADASIRAVLTAPVERMTSRGKRQTVRRKLTKTRTATVFSKVRRRFTLKISAQGIRAVREYDRIEATLEVQVTYRGHKPMLLRRRVVVARKGA